jgi:hypothetical protein
MSAMVVRGAFASKDSAAFSSWWIVVVVDFSVTELMLTVFVMLALWRRPAERNERRCGAAAVAIEKHERFFVASRHGARICSDTMETTGLQNMEVGCGQRGDH